MYRRTVILCYYETGYEKLLMLLCPSKWEFEFPEDFSTEPPQKHESAAGPQQGFMMAANLKLFFMYLNKPH